VTVGAGRIRTFGLDAAISFFGLIKAEFMANDKKPGFAMHLDRNHLPEPEWRFPNAKIEMYATESTPDFPPVKDAPKTME
jgi:hypothetical protein